MPMSILALCALAMPVLSQTLRVQSGDHPGFSRLVIPIGPERTWSLSGDGRLWRLTLEPEVDGFDTSGVFDLIRRDRLAAITVEDALILSLACACEIEAYRFRDRYLVIDIADPTAATSARPDDADAADRRAAAAAALPDLARLLARGGAMTGAASGVQDARTPAEPATDIALEEAAAIMAEQLSRAAASGLLEAELGRPIADADPIPRSATDTPDGSIFETEAPAAARPSPHPQGGERQEMTSAPAVQRPDSGARPLPIRAETAFDAARHTTAGAEQQQSSLACTGQDLDVAQWASSAGVDHGLGQLRLALFDERDRLIPDAALALARHYLFYGFGAEAEFWLTKVEPPPQTLLVLARFLDGQERAGFPPVADSLGCSEDELFWRYMTGSVDHVLSEDQVGTIQRYHAGLPVVLRDHLGPDLARRLADDMHSSAARNVVDTLARGGRLRPSDLALLDLDLGLAPPTEAMRTVLSDALESDGASAAETMAHALALDRATRQPSASRRLVAAEGLLRETPVGQSHDALWQEIVIAHAQSGNFDQAIAMVASAAPLDADVQQDAITHLLENRLDVSDTAGLSAIAHLFGADWRATGSEAGRLRVAAIAHLQEAGLWRAAGALRSDQHALILPAQDPPPFDEATVLASAWADLDWALLAERATEAEQDLAMRMVAATQSPAPAPDQPIAQPETSTDLSSLSRLLDDSRALRSTIRALIPSAQSR